jgi:hypothetical protein
MTSTTSSSSNNNNNKSLPFHERVKNRKRAYIHQLQQRTQKLEMLLDQIDEELALNNDPTRMIYYKEKRAGIFESYVHSINRLDGEMNRIEPEKVNHFTPDEERELKEWLHGTVAPGLLAPKTKIAGRGDMYTLTLPLQIKVLEDFLGPNIIEDHSNHITSRDTIERDGKFHTTVSAQASMQILGVKYENVGVGIAIMPYAGGATELAEKSAVTDAYKRVLYDFSCATGRGINSTEVQQELAKRWTKAPKDQQVRLPAPENHHIVPDALSTNNMNNRQQQQQHSVVGPPPPLGPPPSLMNNVSFSSGIGVSNQNNNLSRHHHHVPPPHTVPNQKRLPDSPLVRTPSVGVITNTNSGGVAMMNPGFNSNNAVVVVSSNVTTGPPLPPPPQDMLEKYGIKRPKIVQPGMTTTATTTTATPIPTMTTTPDVSQSM